MDNAVQIQEAWNDIKQATDELKKQEISSNPLVKIIYARQRIELLKVPEFIKLTNEEINKGNSVVLFVNFTDTLLALSESLGTKCLIYGEQKLDTRDKNIDDFQADLERICICNIKAGNCGISLHDIHGNFPRVAIISPTWSAQDLIQVLGRIHRAKTKSKVLQRIIFCKDTVEDQICEMIQEKIKNIAFINDGSMDSYKIDGLNVNQNKDLYCPKVDITEEQAKKFENVFSKLCKLKERKELIENELAEINKELEETEKILRTVWTPDNNKTNYNNNNNYNNKTNTKSNTKSSSVNNNYTYYNRSHYFPKNN